MVILILNCGSFNVSTLSRPLAPSLSPSAWCTCARGSVRAGTRSQHQQTQAQSRGHHCTVASAKHKVQNQKPKTRKLTRHQSCVRSSRSTIPGSCRRRREGCPGVVGQHMGVHGQKSNGGRERAMPSKRRPRYRYQDRAKRNPGLQRLQDSPAAAHAGCRGSHKLSALASFSQSHSRRSIRQ